MKLLHACVVGLALLLSQPVGALEAVAAHPGQAASCPNEVALQQKVASLTRIVKIMEEQINKCAQKQGITCPSVLMPHTERTVHTVADKPVTDTAEPDMSQSTSTPQATPAYVPATRYGGGFRMAPEPRLTCEDYSESYFQRHPTMAKVCGRQEADEPLLFAPVEEAPAAASGTSVAPETAVSPSAL